MLSLSISLSFDFKSSVLRYKLFDSLVRHFYLHYLCQQREHAKSSSLFPFFSLSRTHTHTHTHRLGIGSILRLLTFSCMFHQNDFILQTTQHTQRVFVCVWKIMKNVRRLTSSFVISFLPIRCASAFSRRAVLFDSELSLSRSLSLSLFLSLWRPPYRTSLSITSSPK